jgi:HlyD family secretion protein
VIKPSAAHRFWNRSRPLLLAVIGAALVLALIAWWQRPPRVQTARPVWRTVVTSVATTGTVQTVVVSPSSAIGGRIEQLHARQGQRVAAGQLLATLDTGELQARLREAETALAAARARQVAVAPDTWQPQLDLARTALAQARLRVAQARRDWQDLQTLARQGAVPRVDADNARVALRAARLQEEDAGARIRQLHVQSRNETRQAGTGVATARAAIETLQAQIDRARIAAPAAGVVTEIEARAGETLAPGGPLLKIARLDSLRIAVQLDEEHLARVRPGLRALMTTDAFPDRSFEGRVEKISPAVDPEQGTIQAIVRPEAVPEYLRPEMTIDVTLVTGRYPRALTIPRAALAGPPDARKVWVVAEGRAEPRRVEVVQGEAGDVAVLRGLAPDDRVILHPTRLRRGQRVLLASSG